VSIGQTVRPAAQVYAALGGFHLFAAKVETLAWNADKLKGFGSRKSWAHTALASSR
jgi:metal-dependent hydrolase (beta-lactamase superfamily II)